MADDVNVKLKASGQSAFSRVMRGAANDVGSIGDRARRSSRGLRAFGAATTSTARGMRLTAGVAGGAAVAGFAALGIAVKRGVAAFEEKRQIVAQTGAVLKSTGGAARVSERQIESLSNRLSRMSGVDDEAIRQGQNLLLTFRDIRNEKGPGNVFAETTRATLDMAAAMGMDMPQAALQVGKALNDPEKGMKRLQRVGVTFTKTQEKQVKHFMAVNDRASAQRVLLRELDKEFGGSARAQMTPLKRLRVSWGNVQEAVGEGLAPAVDTLASKFDRFFVGVEPRVQRFGKRVNDILGRKDLSVGEKLKLTGEAARKAFAPLTNEARTFWSKNREKIIAGAESAVSSAGARMADAAAAAAPHAASMFVSAFKGASPWGQLLTVALVSKKLGVFSTVGRMAAGRMCTSVASRLPGCIGGKMGKAGAFKSVATSIAGGLALSLPAALIAAGLAGVVMAALLPEGRKGLSAESGNPETGRRKHTVQPGDPSGADIWGKRHPDPGPATGGGLVPPAPGDPFTRKGGPAARSASVPTLGGRALIANLTIPVVVDNREIGRAQARLTADDLARM